MASQAIAPAAQVGRYQLHGELAAGGMATVHLGRLVGPVGFAQTVAIKRLHPHVARDPEGVAMFLDEARLAARVQHPNVVRALDVVVTPAEVFLVMEYVHGETLSRLLRACILGGERVPPRIAAAIVLGALHGLHAAHEARDELGQPLGIVHRDVSPQNVIVGADGTARVLDFGVAKAVGRIQSTSDGHLKGKLGYMPPEQLHGAVVDRRVDVYAAAVVLWESLACRRLFDGETHAAIMGKISRGAHEPPSRFAPGVGADLDAVVLRGLATDPEARFATARAMAIELEQVGVASQREVGEWVERVASAELARRAALVAEIECATRPDVDPAALRRAAAASSSLAAGAAVFPHGITLGDPAVTPSATTTEPTVLEAPTVVERSPRGGLAGASHDAPPGASLAGLPASPGLVAGSARPGAAPSAEGGQPSSRRVALLAAAIALVALVAAWVGAGRAGPSQAPVGEFIGESPGRGVGGAPDRAAQQAPSVRVSDRQTEPPAPEASVPTVAVSALPPSPGAPLLASSRSRRHEPEAAPPAAIPPQPRPSRTAGCDPPFRVDADGIRHFKPECQ